MQAQTTVQCNSHPSSQQQWKSRQRPFWLGGGKTGSETLREGSWADSSDAEDVVYSAAPLLGRGPVDTRARAGEDAVECLLAWFVMQEKRQQGQGDNLRVLHQ